MDLSGLFLICFSLHVDILISGMLLLRRLGSWERDKKGGNDWNVFGSLREDSFSKGD